MAEIRMSRRGLLTAAAAGAAATLFTADRADQARAVVTTFDSPPSQPYLDPLPVPPNLIGGGDLAVAPAAHQFHSWYPTSVTWGYGGQSYHGPTVQVHSGDPVALTFRNHAQRHALAANVDVTLEGVTTADITSPRTNVHLHGHLSRPEDDGNPMHTFRPGQQKVYSYENGLAARHLWYHDHSMGLTRLNVAAGLSAQYLVRDDWDTGYPDNPLGLPAADFEIPLQIQDRTFDPNGRLWYRFTPLAAANRWSGTWAGDRAVVNGVVWPRLSVARGVYRFRIVNSSSARFYGLTLRNQAPMYVIGTDMGLLNAPVPVSNLMIAPAERYDVLIDFRNVPAGSRIELRNTEGAPSVDALLGVGGIPQIMAFDVTSTPGAGYGVPTTLRGGQGQPPLLGPTATPTRRRIMNLGQLLDISTGFPPAMLALNNLDYMTDHVDVMKTGAVELWDLVNDTDINHAIHLHMAGSIRIVARRPFAYLPFDLLNPRPAMGTYYSPSPDNYLTGALTGPAAYEVGDKDTVIAPARQVTRLIVTWPAASELPFNPDASYDPGFGITTDPTWTPPATATGAMPAMSEADMSGPLGGYMWHCHMLDHEDHVMMLPFRLQW